MRYHEKFDLRRAVPVIDRRISGASELKPITKLGKVKSARLIVGRVDREGSHSPSLQGDDAMTELAGGNNVVDAVPALDRFLRRAEVIAITGLSYTTLYRKMIDGSFPRQYVLGEKAVAWKESEVREWCETRPRVK